MGGGIFFADVRAHQFAEFLDGVVHDEADIADTESGDACDFLVRAVVQKLEAYDFALIGPQTVHTTPDVFVKLMHAGILRGVRLLIGGRIDDILVAKVQPLLLAQDVERTVAADGEQPGFKIFADSIRLREVKSQHRILYDIPRTLDVSTKDAGCVGDKSAFMLV